MKNNLHLFVLIFFLVFSLMNCTKEDNGEIEIGAVLVLTGSDARTGENAKRGIELALEEINAKGGIRGKTLKIIYEDDQGNPNEAVSAVHKLINVNKVPVIIGPLWSTSVLAVAPIVEKNKVVLISPTASNPKISNAGDYIFRNTYSDIFEGEKTAEFAYNKLGYRSTSILYINNDYGLGLKNSFVEKFKNLGGAILQAEPYDPTSLDYKTILLKIIKKKPDVIYLIGYGEMGQVLRQSKEIGIKIQFISCIMFEVSDILNVAGDSSEGVIYSFPSYDPQKGKEVTKEFAYKFKAKYGYLPDSTAAFSYDALNIIAISMNKAGFSAENIKNSLYKIQKYIGVSGETTFDKNGDVTKPLGFKHILNGQYKWLIYEY